MNDNRLIELLRTTSHIVVLTGAGVSAESGVPTFRDALTGLWERFDPAQLATPEAFARDRELICRWYEQRRCNVAKCVPNPGHLAARRMSLNCMVLSGSGDAPIAAKKSKKKAQLLIAIRLFAVAAEPVAQAWSGLANNYRRTLSPSLTAPRACAIFSFRLAPAASFFPPPV